MSNKSSENYLDNLLNSINGIEEQEPELEAEELLEDEFGFMTSESGPKEERDISEDDFLRQFESELHSSEYGSYLNDFEMELETGKNSDRDELESAGELTGFEDESLDDIISGLEASDEPQEMDDGFDNSDIGSNADLDSALGEFDADFGFDDIDALGDLSDLGIDNLDSVGEPEGALGGDAGDGITVDTLEPGLLDGVDSLEDLGKLDLSMTEVGEPDLAGNANADLEDILGGEGLSELGDLLSGEGEVSEDGADPIGDFAEKEMQSASGGGAASDGVGQEPEKKLGFFAKLKKLLFGDDEEEEAAVEIGSLDAGADPDALSAENEQILKELEGEGAEGGKKKEKKKKEKKEKPKKEKKPKEKKEKKPKVKDNTPPLPKVPVIMIFVMVGSLMALVLLSTNTAGYSTQVSSSRTLFNQGLYSEAFREIEGIEVKGDDVEMYNQIKVLAAVSSEFESYKIFIKNDMQEEALDSLVCAAGRYDLNYEDAEEYGCADKMDELKSEIKKALKERYNMSFKKALKIYKQKNRDAYSVELHKQLVELGLE